MPEEASSRFLDRWLHIASTRFLEEVRAGCVNMCGGVNRGGGVNKGGEVWSRCSEGSCAVSTRKWWGVRERTCDQRRGPSAGHAPAGAEQAWTTTARVMVTSGVGLGLRLSMGDGDVLRRSRTAAVHGWWWR
eukprot:230713-Chlamydomonas_euryale.AAC.3